MIVSELSWLNRVKLKYGPQVSLIDLSSGGAQIETNGYPLQPGSTVVIEIAAGERSCPVPAQVLRCHIAGLAPNARYRGALLFKRSFEMPETPVAEDATDVDCNPAHEYARLNLALKRVFAAGEPATPAPAIGALTPIGARALDAAFAMIESARGRHSVAQFTREMGQLLRAITRSVENAATSDAIMSGIVERLWRSVPSLSVRVVDGGSALRIHNDAVYFDVPSPTDRTPARLVVEFPRDCRLEEWHLLLLQGAASLIGMTKNFEPNRENSKPAAAPEPETGGLSTAPVDLRGWNRLVLRYLDGRLLKGYSRDFQPSRGAVHLWSELGGPAESRITIPLAHLKAVFYVNDFEGNPAYVSPPSTDQVPTIGRRVTITFVDGEVVRGTTLSYSEDGPGFFVSPVDGKTNNMKMFVMSGAIRHVQFR
jgi:hypothetical protein